MDIILQDEALLLDIALQPYPGNVYESAVNVYCRISPQETTGSVPGEYGCFYSIASQILELNVALDRHIPRSAINVTMIGRYLYGWSRLRKQLGSYLMHNDEMLGVMKLRVVS